MEDKVKELLQNAYERIEKGNIPQKQKTALKNNKIDRDALAWFFLISEASLIGINTQDIITTKIAQENIETVNNAIKKYEENFSFIMMQFMNGKL